MHLVFGMPYTVTTIFWLVVLAVVFFLWNRSEHTLDIHSITTNRREKYYWAVVFATFCLGTARRRLHRHHRRARLPPLGAPLLRGHLDPVRRLEVPGLEQHLLLLVRLRDHPTGRGLVRRLPLQGTHDLSGVDFGDWQTALVLTCVVVVLVGYTAMARYDIQSPDVEMAGGT